MMQKNNSVVFKGRKEGITVMLDETASFSEIKETLASKLQDAKKFFGDSKTSIAFKGRELSENDEAELLDIIKQSSYLNISYINSEDDSANKAKTASLNAAQVHIEGIAEKSMTYYHSGSLRSGQSIEFDGSVVIIGDVNPGAEVFAAYNIIVMGTVKGLVHAGCKGDYKSFVTALSLRPVQLRIADIYTVLPPEETKKKAMFPVIAYIEGKKIFIEPLQKME